jgi:arylsulfatase A-like enzyme
VAAPRHEGLFAEEPVDLPPNFNEVDADQPAYYQGLDDADAGHMRAIARDKWEAGLAVDEAVEALSQTLESRGVAERTVLLFVSDNSFSLGSHRHFGKNCLYEECARVPMLVRYPGGETGATDSPVSNVDLAATLADLGGTEAGLPADGRSLTPFLSGKRPWPASRDLLLEVHRDKRGVPNGWAIVTHRWKYAEHNTGERELYRLETDPYEMDNLADEPQFEDEQAELAARLAELRD